MCYTKPARSTRPDPNMARTQEQHHILRSKFVIQPVPLQVTMIFLYLFCVRDISPLFINHSSHISRDLAICMVFLPFSFLPLYVLMVCRNLPFSLLLSLYVCYCISFSFFLSFSPSCPKILCMPKQHQQLLNG